MKKVILVFITVLLFACKDETKETPPAKITESIPEFVVTLNCKTNKVDEFKFILNNIIVDEFQKKNIEIVEKVLPSNELEVIKANFGPNNFSKNLQITLGNREVKVIEIKSVNISYNKKSVYIKASELAEYFVFNKYASLEEDTFKVMTKKVDGKHVPRMKLKAKALNKLVVNTKQ